MKQFFKSLLSFLILAAADVAIIISAFGLAITIRNFLGNFIEIPNLLTDDPLAYQLNNWWIIPLYVAIFWIEGLYTKHRPFWQEAKVLSRAIFITALTVYSFISLGRIDEYISRILFVLHPLILMGLLPLTRRILKSILFKLGYWKTQIVEVRIDTEYSLKESFSRNQFIGYSIVDSIKVSLENEEYQSIIESTKKTQERTNSNSLLVVVKDITSPKVGELVERLYFISDHILVVPEMLDLDVLNADVYHMMYENLFIFDINKGLNAAFNQFLKRIIDILLSTIGIIIFSPILLFVSILVLIADGMPIFYNHDRFGKGGKIFTFHKFRSMRNERYPDENFELVKKYVANDPVKKLEWEKFQKLENDPNDPRILKGMNIIRRTSLDELAQLFNVFKGDMSIVGPRPFMPREREMMGDYFDRVLAAKPGITDLWTVSGRNSLTFEQRLKMSTWYIQNWSLWLDFVIIAKTIQQVISYFFKWSKRSKK